MDWEQAKMAYVRNNNDQLFAAYMLDQEIDHIDSFEQIDSLMHLLSPSIPENGFSIRLQTKWETWSRLVPGKLVPDFTVPTPEGDSITLSSLKGRVVLIDFWASWCSLCRAANPQMVKLYDQYKGKDFVILGISLDDNARAWKDAIRKDKLTWLQGSNLVGWDDPVAGLYAVSAIPTTILIDKEGNLVARNLHGAELSEKINELLAE